NSKNAKRSATTRRPSMIAAMCRPISTTCRCRQPNNPFPTQGAGWPNAAAESQPEKSMNTISEQASVAEEIAELIRRGRDEHKDYLLREAHALMDGPEFLALPEWRQRK